MKPIKLNKSYIHNKTNKKYYTKELAKLKVGDAWVECVIYENQSGVKFVRKTEDFSEYFSEY